jgi:hypothetical protein
MTIAELFATLGLETDEASFEKGEKLIEGVKTALEALAVYEGIKKLHEMVESTVEAGVAFKHLGEKLGISAESVQELGYAADVSGASVDEMQTGLQHLAMQMEEVKKTGTGPLAEGLGKLKLSASQISKLPLDDQLARIASAFADAGPEVNKTGVAMEIFGRSGTALIPLLNKGADGLAELREEFVATGAELDGNAIESLEHYEETQKRLHYIMVGFKNEAVMALLPQLQSLADGLQKWIKANHELIRQRIQQVVAGIIVVLKAFARIVNIAIKVLGVLAEIVDRVAEAFGALIGGSDGLEDVLVGAAIAVGAAWALATAPLLIMAALVAALILVVQDLWSGLNGGDSVLKNLYHAFVQWLGETGAGRVVLGLIAGVKAVINFLEEQIERLINLGRRLGSYAAFVKLRNQHYAEIAELNPGLSPAEIQKRAEDLADYDLKRGEAEENARKYGTGGYGKLGTSGQSVLQSTAAPSINDLTSSHQSFAPVFAPQITVQTNSDDPHAVADAVHQRVSYFWDDQMSHAANAVGATGGSNLP